MMIPVTTEIIVLLC